MWIVIPIDRYAQIYTNAMKGELAFLKYKKEWQGSCLLTVANARYFRENK